MKTRTKKEWDVTREEYLAANPIVEFEEWAWGNTDDRKIPPMIMKGYKGHTRLNQIVLNAKRTNNAFSEFCRTKLSFPVGLVVFLGLIALI